MEKKSEYKNISDNSYNLKDFPDNLDLTQNKELNEFHLKPNEIQVIQLNGDLSQIDPNITPTLNPRQLKMEEFKHKTFWLRIGNAILLGISILFILLFIFYLISGNKKNKEKIRHEDSEHEMEKGKRHKDKDDGNGFVFGLVINLLIVPIAIVGIKFIATISMKLLKIYTISMILLLFLLIISLFLAAVNKAHMISFVLPFLEIVLVAALVISARKLRVLVQEINSL